MTERLTYSEIKARYAPEWVLLGDVEVDEGLEVVSGDVLCHTPDREELSRRMLELRPSRCAIRYLGQIPEDLVILL